MKTAETAILAWLDQRLARHDKALDRAASWLWRGFLCFLITWSILAMTGCSAISEIGIGPAGVTFRFRVSAEQHRAGQDLDVERDDEQPAAP